MRVFCHEHKRGFFAPRQNPIRCENRGHVLGELDFTGQHRGDDSFSKLHWQYCCNCEHFCVVDVEAKGLQGCPVCTRRSSILYLCDRCHTVSFESNTQVETKNFSLTPDGLPVPCCPGCLHPSPADLREHSCDFAEVSFVSALNTCPFCKERLDIGPTFPATVAYYLRKTKAANKTFVTFDYECGLFVPVEDGEFVLIGKNDDTNRTYILPRSPQLGSLRDFYELYQDYYHCAAPEPGEITISDPAVVVPMSEGWKLLAPGVFVVIDDQPKRRIAPPAHDPQADIATRQMTVETDGSSFVRKTNADEGATPCTYCDTLIEAKYAFCWKCGSARNDNLRASNRQLEKPVNAPEAGPGRSRLIVQAADDDDLDSRTVQHEQRASLLQRRELNGSDWLSQPSREPSLSRGRSVLKLFVIAVVGLLLISFAVLGLKAVRSAPPPQNALATRSEQSVQTTSGPEPATQPAANVEMTPVALKTPVTDMPELALAQLRQMSHSDSDHSMLLRSLSEKEMKYADDYRFPYESARVVAIDHKKDFHYEAFAALTRAAKKAINNGKSNEMLESLNKDSAGDFSRLSRGHREWAQLQRALKSRNAGVLSVNSGM